MDNQAAYKQVRQITYSCYSSQVREGEQFIPDHIFSYQVSGTLLINDGRKTYQLEAGDFRLTRRNSLIKFVKRPPEQGDYRNISIFLSQDILRDFSLEFGYTGQKKIVTGSVIRLPTNRLLTNYMQSLQPYDELMQAGKETLLSIKRREAIALLIQTEPALNDILFDFSEPGKIDLEAFMNQNFQFNVSLDRFAYLTGRSLSGFKRDFLKIFHRYPGQWLLQKRLESAYYLITEKGVAASNVYLDVGFENLSHFSYAFKKMYGSAPTKLRKRHGLPD